MGKSNLVYFTFEINVPFEKDPSVFAKKLADKIHICDFEFEDNEGYCTSLISALSISPVNAQKLSRSIKAFAKANSTKVFIYQDLSAE